MESVTFENARHRAIKGTIDVLIEPFFFIFLFWRPYILVWQKVRAKGSIG